MGCAQSSDPVEVGCGHGVNLTTFRVDRPATPCFSEKYELISEVGRGSYGIVYSIMDIRNPYSDKELVVKVLDLCSKSGSARLLGCDSDKGKSLPRAIDSHAGHQARDKKIERMFLNELSVLSKVSSIEYCVKLVDSFCESGSGYLVMERLDIELYAMLRSFENFNERTFVPIARDMLAGLAAIHKLSIVHHDVKPDNFAFSKTNNVVKLLDFGFSKCLTAEQPFSNVVKGTAPFMSPELLIHGYCGVQTDIWGVGVCIYAILLGRFPYMPLVPREREMENLIRSGLPIPSFCASRSKDCLNPSSDSIDLLRQLIDRDPSTRATAKSALTHSWFEVSEASCHCSHTLQPLLTSAKNVGAFRMPLRNNASKAIDKLEQDQSRRTCEAFVKISVVNSCKSPRVHPQMAQDVLKSIHLVPI